MAYDLNTLLAQAQKTEEAARAANIERREQISSIYDEIIKRYSPGGEFQKGSFALLEREKVRDVAAATQGLVSSGLYGTSMTAGIPKMWEEEVGAPRRMAIEDLMMERLSGAQVGKASFLERIEEPYPDYGMIAQLAGQAGTAGGEPFRGVSVTMGSKGTTTSNYWEQQEARQSRLAAEEAAYQAERARLREQSGAEPTPSTPARAAASPESSPEWAEEGGGKITRTPPPGLKSTIDRILKKGPPASMYYWDVYKEYLPLSYSPYRSSGSFGGGGGGTFRGYGATGSW